MVLLSAHQPCYLPWLGYFNKIVNSDIFVLLDDVQFEKGSYINRVQIKTAQGPHWLTIPVPRDSYNHKINEIWVGIPTNDGNWREKHVKTILHNYKRSDYFYDAKSWGNDIISHLATTLIRLLEQVCSALEISTPIYKQPECGGIKQDLIINLCKHFNADAFLFGAKGRDYVDVHYFKAHGIEPIFQDFKCIEYPQQWGGGFVPGLSVIDALFNCGAEKTMDLIKGGYSVR